MRRKCCHCERFERTVVDDYRSTEKKRKEKKYFWIVKFKIFRNLFKCHRLCLFVILLKLFIMIWILESLFFWKTCCKLIALVDLKMNSWKIWYEKLKIQQESTKYSLPPQTLLLPHQQQSITDSPLSSICHLTRCLLTKVLMLLS